MLTFKHERLEALVNYYCDGNKAKFATMIGITPQLLSNWIKRDTLDFEVVYQGCPNLSGDWLLSGEGPMIKDDKQNDNSQNDNSELITLCRSLVANYQQRDEVMGKLVSMVKGLE
ncbi:MAG: hypothetical protein SPL96_10940 [Bacteroidales bacterium]|nr:hypothetical protein [Bacteroidales bacterium]